MTTPEANRPLTGDDVTVSYDDMVALYNERTGPMRGHRDDYASWSQVPISVQSAVIAYDAARRGGSNEAPMSERNALSLAGMMRQALTATTRGFDDAIDDDLRRLRERLSTAERQRDEAVRALEFYGDPISYAITQAKEPRSSVHGDDGKRARQTLQSIGSGE